MRFDPEMVTELVATAPSEFVLHAPDPARHLPMGGRSVTFAAVASPPNVADRAGGRRTGNREDFRRLVMLSEVLNSVSHTGGYPVEPVDVHSSVRHLVATRDLLTLSRKAIHCYSLGAQRNQDCLEMVRIVRGVTHDDLEAQPSIFTVVNCNSPAAPRHAHAGGDPAVLGPQPGGGGHPVHTGRGHGAGDGGRRRWCSRTPRPWPGSRSASWCGPARRRCTAGSPPTSTCSRVAPAFGTPRVHAGGAARGPVGPALRDSLPVSNACAANAVDAQAAYESMFSLWAVIMGGAHMVMHGAGWMEGGLQASFEKMVIGRGPDRHDRGVPGACGHRRGLAGGGRHSPRSVRAAISSARPTLWPVSAMRSSSRWCRTGATSSPGRRRARPPPSTTPSAWVAELLDVYEPPTLADDVRAELDDFTDRRIAEGGVETDF